MHVSSNVQLLFIKDILGAILRILVICLASKKSHSEICLAYIFLAWCGEIHFNYFTMISHFFSYDITGKEQNISFHSTQVFCYILQMPRYHFSVDEPWGWQKLCFVVFMVQERTTCPVSNPLPPWPYSSTLTNPSYSVMYGSPSSTSSSTMHSSSTPERARRSIYVDIVPGWANERCFEEVRLCCGSE